uniref:DDHD domain-containing protein n=1 Tax=Timema douglasi TaxID=61478 RepID=A0A7R8VIG9_TIMDO|nr:unnamed protein product [Timema douglasi]
MASLVLTDSSQLTSDSQHLDIVEVDSFLGQDSASSASIKLSNASTFPSFTSQPPGEFAQARPSETSSTGAQPLRYSTPTPDVPAYSPLLTSVVKTPSITPTRPSPVQTPGSLTSQPSSVTQYVNKGFPPTQPLVSTYPSRTSPGLIPQPLGSAYPTHTSPGLIPQPLGSTYPTHTSPGLISQPLLPSTSFTSPLAASVVPLSQGVQHHPPIQTIFSTRNGPQTSTSLLRNVPGSTESLSMVSSAGSSTSGQFFNPSEVNIETSAGYFATRQNPSLTSLKSVEEDITTLSSKPPQETVAPFSQGLPSSAATPVARVAPLGGSSNTYRLGNKKKLVYAQPPGLSRSSAPPLLSSLTPSVSPAPPLLSSPTPFVSPALQSLPSSIPLSDSTTNVRAFQPSALGGDSAIIAATMTPTQLPTSEILKYQPSVQTESQSSLTVLPPSFSNLELHPHFNGGGVENHLGKSISSSPDQDLNLNLPIHGSLVQHETSALANYATEAQGQAGMMYREVYHHWFFKKEVEGKVLWQPFSMVDSLALEEAFTSTDISPEMIVPTDGGRYDVNVLRRQRSAVYWNEPVTEVRRCSWFYKGAIDTRYVPYEENVSTRLEEEFKIATTTNVWHRKVEFPNKETVVFHGPNVMVHFLQGAALDVWGNTPQTPSRPRVVKRGVDEFDIDEGEPAAVDHVLFLVHGIGSVCDLKFRKVEEVVDEFRSLSLQLVQSHFRSSYDLGRVSRIEVLPVSWHATLHGEATGIDRKLKSITLRSIPKLRHFTNDTLLDILFYTSPVYCQTIMQTVGNELNRLYNLFLNRNPNFQGGVSLGGHSLGSLILFDLLYHQKPPPQDQAPPAADSSVDTNTIDDENSNPGAAGNKVPPEQRKLNHQVSYMMGNAGTGQPCISYPQLTFQPLAFFALGSPIAMFVTVRGIETLGEDFCLPTCPGFFNIFHPFDPVAYRMETLINPELTSLRPVLIPHHKGRKRMHLELKETMARVGADLKQRVIESVKSTWNTVYQLAMFHRTEDQALEQEVDKVLEEQMHRDETESTHSVEGEVDQDVCVGQLNSGRRVDYVLQEAPFESFNEYLFALGSHVCYCFHHSEIFWYTPNSKLKMIQPSFNPNKALSHVTKRLEKPAKYFIQQKLSLEISPTPSIPLKAATHNGMGQFPMRERPIPFWFRESEDTMLMILKEVYSLLGISADTHVQHQHSPAERDSSNFLQPLHSDSLLIGSPTLSPVFDSPQVSSRPLVATLPVSNHNSSSGFDPPSLSQGVHLASHSAPALNQPPLGMDPTAPPSDIINVGPPPVSGFLRK